MTGVQLCLLPPTSHTCLPPPAPFSSGTTENVPVFISGQGAIDIGERAFRIRTLSMNRRHVHAHPRPHTHTHATSGGTAKASVVPRGRSPCHGAVFLDQPRIANRRQGLLGCPRSCPGGTGVRIASPAPLRLFDVTTQMGGPASRGIRVPWQTQMQQKQASKKHHQWRRCLSQGRDSGPGAWDLSTAVSGARRRSRGASPLKMRVSTWPLGLGPGAFSQVASLSWRLLSSSEPELPSIPIATGKMARHFLMCSAAGRQSHRRGPVASFHVRGACQARSI